MDKGNVYQGELNEYSNFIRTTHILRVIMKNITKKKRFTNGSTSLDKSSSRG